MNAEAPQTDFDNLPEVRDKYRALKTQVNGSQGPQSSSPAPGTLPPLPPAPKPAKGQQKPSRRRRRGQGDQEPAPEANDAAKPPLSVDDLKDIERFKLWVWIAKLVMLSMTGIVFICMALYGYTAYATKSMPDMGLFGTIFGHLKEVLVVVIEAQK